LLYRRVAHRYGQCWRFHLSALVLIVQIVFTRTFFQADALFDGKKGLGDRDIGEVGVGPWSVRRMQKVAPTIPRSLRWRCARLALTK
jgi:hypothetical protein